MTTTKRVAVAALAAASLMLAGDSGLANGVEPFAALPGRWVGDGRLGFKDGKVEIVKCRATYFLADDTDQLTQNIRCAAASGAIEVKSSVTHQSGSLSGTWSEEMHNMAGVLTGQVTKQGFRVIVKGDDMSANMEIIVKGVKQIIEIQFNTSALVGLSLVLEKN